MRFLGLFLGLLVLSGGVFAEEQVPTITLSATGSVSATPDRGYISLGVVNKAATSAEAVAENAQSMSDLYKSLGVLGVTKDNIQTTEFSVRQVYKQIRVPLENGRYTTENKPDGFQVTNMVKVTVCELDQFGKILDASVGDGANSVSGVSFGSSQSVELTDKARAAAVERLLVKANILTKGLGVTLGDVLSIQEQQHGGQPLRYAAMSLSAEKSDTPVSGGSLDFSATVTVQWKLLNENPLIDPHPLRPPPHLPQ